MTDSIFGKIQTNEDNIEIAQEPVLQRFKGHIENKANGNSHYVWVHPDVLDNELSDVFEETEVLVMGNRRKRTVCRIFADPNLAKNAIAMSRITRNNVAIKMGDKISLKEIEEVSMIAKISCAPFQDNVANLGGDLRSTY